MPQLVEYVNKEGIQPTDRGTEARVQEGRRIGAAFNQVAESRRDFGNRAAQQIGGAIRDAGDAAVQQIEHRQINQGVDTYWQLRNQKENEWNDIIKGNPDKGIPPADPHDPSVAQRFMTDNLAPALQDWSDTFQTEGGQKFAQARVSSFLDHMSEKTTADMGTLAKVQIDTSLRAIGNTSSNIAYNDPSAVPHLMDDIRSSVEAMVNSSPNLKGADAARAKMELSEKYIQQAVKAGAFGAISKSSDPETTADQWARDPRYTKYFTGEEGYTLGKAAKSAAKTNELTDRQNARFAREQADDKVKIDAGKVFQKNVAIDGATGKVTLKPEFFKDAFNLVAANPSAPNAVERAQALLNWGQREQQERRERVVSDPNVKNDLYTRIFSAENPTSDVDILKARADDKLDQYDSANLLALHKAVEDRPLTGPIWRDTMESVKGLLGTDPQGHEAFGKFVSAFIPEYQRMSRAGTLPPNALDLRDPNSMISQVMAPYRRTPDQMFIDRLSHGLVAPGALGNVPEEGGATRRNLAPPVPVKSIEDAQKLNPGRRYITPDGKVFIR